MKYPFLVSSSLIGCSSLGALYLKDKDIGYKVKDALTYSGFTLLDPSTTYTVGSTTKKCSDAFVDFHLFLSNPSYREARKYCTVPRTFADLAKQHGFQYIETENKDSENYESDLLWSLKLKEDNDEYDKDWEKLGNSGNKETTKTYEKTTIESKLSEELKVFDDTKEKDKYVATIVDILNKHEEISDLKTACWALSSQTHADDNEEQAWYVFLKYCTRRI